MAETSVFNGSKDISTFRRQVDRLGYTHDSIAAVRGTLNISELTRSLLAENKVKECPELTALKKSYNEGIDTLERNIREAEERIHSEIREHEHTKQEKLDLEDEVQSLQSRLAEEEKLITEVKEAREIQKTVSRLKADNSMLQATVDTLRQRISQSDRERVLEAQLLAAREESKSLHADIDTAVASLRLEREKCNAMQDAVKGAEERALKAEERSHALEEELAKCRELLSESRGLFVHGAHIDDVIDRARTPTDRNTAAARARPTSRRDALNVTRRGGVGVSDVYDSPYDGAPYTGENDHPHTTRNSHNAYINPRSTSNATLSAFSRPSSARADSYGRTGVRVDAKTALDARGHVLRAPGPADVLERDKQQRLEEARARAAARSSDYRARQQRVSMVHGEWRKEQPANVMKRTATMSGSSTTSSGTPAATACMYGDDGEDDNNFGDDGTGAVSATTVARDRRARYTPHRTHVLPAPSVPSRSPSRPPLRAFVAAARGSTGAIGDRLKEERERETLRRVSTSRSRATLQQPSPEGGAHTRTSTRNVTRTPSQTRLHSQMRARSASRPGSASAPSVRARNAASTRDGGVAQARNLERVVMSMPHGAPVEEEEHKGERGEGDEGSGVVPLPVSVPGGGAIDYYPASVHMAHRAPVHAYTHAHAHLHTSTQGLTAPHGLGAPGNGITGTGWGVPKYTHTVAIARPPVAVASAHAGRGREVDRYGYIGGGVNVPWQSSDVPAAPHEEGMGLMNQMIAEARQRDCQNQK